VLWRTDEMRQQKPTVLEEIQAGLDYFRYSLFDAVCTTYRYAENSLGVSTLHCWHSAFSFADGYLQPTVKRDNGNRFLGWDPVLFVGCAGNVLRPACGPF
jgi:hypothetical protein